MKQLLQKAKEKEKGGLLFVPKEGDNDIRLLPNKYEPELLFVPVWLHYAGNGLTNKTFFSPLTFGEPDAVMEFVEEETSNRIEDKDEYFRLDSLAPKPAYMCPVIVRGSEDDGVKWLVLSGGKRWEGDFKPSGQYKRFLENYEKVFRKRILDDDFPDVTDINRGHDLNISLTPKEKTDTGYSKTDFMFDFSPSTLFPKEMYVKKNGKMTLTDEAKALLKEWTQDTPSFEEVYDRKSSSDVEKLLEKYIQGDHSSSNVSEKEYTEEEFDESGLSDGVDEADILKQADAVFDEDVEFDEDATFDDTDFSDFDDDGDDLPV